MMVPIIRQRSKQPIKSQLIRSWAAAFSSNTQPPVTSSHDETQVGNNLSRLLTSEQKTLLRQAQQLAAQSRNLARQVGNVTVREDSLLSEIVRLKNKQLGKVQSSSQVDSDSSGLNASKLDDESNQDNVSPSLFTVVFAGEFNSGKSTLINALLGKELLESGVLPTTDAITVLMGDEDASAAANQSTDGLMDTSSSLPAQLHLLPTTQYPLLCDLCLIDTPGTNAIMALQHTASKLKILHNADLLIFVTSADRPFSESEKELLRTSMTYRKRVLVVINKMDILERHGGDHGDASKNKVIEYVTEHASDLLGGRPVVIPVSGRDALSVKMLGGRKDEDGLWKRCNFGNLEHYLLDTLTASSKIKTKLLNPIGVAEGMLLDCQNEIKQRIDDLDLDVKTLRLLNSQTAFWQKELQREVMDQCRKDIKALFVKRSQIVDVVIGQLSIIDLFKLGLGMGRVAFDNAWVEAVSQTQNIAIRKQTNATNNQQREIERDLVAIVNECAETITSRAKSQGENSREYLGKIPFVISSTKRDHVSNIIGVGRITSPKFGRLQDDLNQSFMDAIQTATARLPSDAESSNRMYSLLSKTSLLSTFLCANALTSGPIGMYSGALDSTTATATSLVLLSLGGMTIPLGKIYASQICEKEWTSHAKKLDASLETLFNEVLRRVSTQLAESVAPYSRFVNGEGEYLAEMQNKVESCISKVNILRNKVNEACD
ncbi:hypothetical protein ACHAXN_007085 [Cyclotella atomus]